MQQIFAVLVIFLAFAAARIAATPDDVRLSIDGAGAIVVPVTINGQGPYAFLLDTGASASVVSSNIAARLQLSVVAKTTVLTSTGSELRLVVKLARTAIGSSAAEGLLASIVSAADLNAIIPGIDGVIGQDFLSKFNYTIDYRKKRLTWTTEGAGARTDTRLALIEESGRFLVELPADQKHAVALRLVPDSGAEGFVVFERDGRTALALELAEGETGVISLNGRSDARTAVLRELHVGDATVRNQRAAILWRDRADMAEGDGLLPLHVFASVSFNSQERYFVARAH